MSWLSWPMFNLAIEGLQKCKDARYANRYNNQSYSSFHLTRLNRPHDPPHERSWIAHQIGGIIDGQLAMTGFVQSYYKNGQLPGPGPEVQPEVMGYFTPSEVPVTEFFPSQLCGLRSLVLVHPARTQLIRLMAMSVYTLIDGNVDLLKGLLERIRTLSATRARELMGLSAGDSMPNYQDLITPP